MQGQIVQYSQLNRHRMPMDINEKLIGFEFLLLIKMHATPQESARTGVPRGNISNFLASIGFQLL